MCSHILKLFLSTMFIIFLTAVPIVHAERYNYTTDLSPLDDALIVPSCEESAPWAVEGTFEHQVRREFGVEQDDWDNGFGYTVCDADTGYGRTLNAIYLLSKIGRSVPGDWGWYGFAAGKIDDLDAVYANGPENLNGNALAAYHSSEDVVNIYLPFYNLGVGGPVKRASTIVHEARHYDVGHECNSDCDICDREASCDWSWEEGERGREEEGANTWQVKFLVDVVCFENPEGQDHTWIINPFLRRQAALHAEYILSDGFQSTTGTIKDYLTCQDRDRDYIPDFIDNCPSVPNPPCPPKTGSVTFATDCDPSYMPDQADTDGDGVGDACDLCPGAVDSKRDRDNDGIDDACDLCPSVGGSNKDSDGDGIGDACDDGGDEDGVMDVVDNCPSVKNPKQENMDSDRLGDACDDSDSDGVMDDLDNCDSVPIRDQTDTDRDGQGDVCDDDDDNDGVKDVEDNCPLDRNEGQENSDKDKFGDRCDNCPNITNPDQGDLDRDNIGDVCDDDIDRDGIVNDNDQCPGLGRMECFSYNDKTGCPILTEYRCPDISIKPGVGLIKPNIDNPALIALGDFRDIMNEAEKLLADKDLIVDLQNCERIDCNWDSARPMKLVMTIVDDAGRMIARQRKDVYLKKNNKGTVNLNFQAQSKHLQPVTSSGKMAKDDKKISYFLIIEVANKAEVFSEAPSKNIVFTLKTTDTSLKTKKTKEPSSNVNKPHK